MSTEETAYHELCGYTLTRGDPEFIHQHVVDAWAAQHAHADSKPIGVWPIGALPTSRSALTVLDVMAKPEGTAREMEISRWAKSVWEAHAGSRESVEAALTRRGIS